MANIINDIVTTFGAFILAMSIKVKERTDAHRDAIKSTKDNVAAQGLYGSIAVKVATGGTLTKDEKAFFAAFSSAASAPTLSRGSNEADLSDAYTDPEGPFASKKARAAIATLNAEVTTWYAAHDEECTFVKACFDREGVKVMHYTKLFDTTSGTPKNTKLKMDGSIIELS
jgi:hypothetical protein